jgi:hypothetical protein
VEVLRVWLFQQYCFQHHGACVKGESVRMVVFILAGNSACGVVAHSQVQELLAHCRVVHTGISFFFGAIAGQDHMAAIWSPISFYDDVESRWYMTFVGYACPGNSDGVILLAQSTVAGPSGIGGPYVSAGVVLSRHNNSGEPWEGAQGDDSFTAFHGLGEGSPLLGLYGSSNGASYWSVGLARSDSGTIHGPWTRAATGNPLQVNGQRTENPIVLKVAHVTPSLFFSVS